MAVYIRKPEPSQKLRDLGMGSKFDVSGYPSLLSAKRRMRFSFIYPSVGKGGRLFPLFKVLQSNACDGNCYYCANRKEREFRRVSFSPSELAKLFIRYYEAGVAQGLFLSSAIYGGPSQVEERMLETVRLVREIYGFRGYIHLKVLPGTDDDLIAEAAKYADRLSINLEAPSPVYLSRLSPSKDYTSQLMRGVESIAKQNRRSPLKAGVTTQVVVGPAGEIDRELMELAHQLYQRLGIWRVYYSGFTPIKGTPFEGLSPCSKWRETRLYQADFLLRRYGFSPSELPYDHEGNLPQDVDPKFGWALAHPERFPVEVEKAPFGELMRVPGIGRISAQRIVNLRRREGIRGLEGLRRMGVVVNRARNFITLRGKFSPSPEKKERIVDEQLFLWEEL